MDSQCGRDGKFDRMRSVKRRPQVLEKKVAAINVLPAALLRRPYGPGRG